MNDTRRILIEARELLARDGWCQGTYHKDGKHCMMGALQQVGVQMHSAEYNAVVRILQGAVSKVWPYGAEVVSYNDVPSRTVEEVLAVFDKAINLACGYWFGYGSHWGWGQ